MSQALRAKNPAEVDKMYTLKVSNLSSKVDKEYMLEKFEKFGEVGDIFIPREKPFGFVRFINKRDAEDAKEGMDGRTICGQEVEVIWAEHKRNLDPNYGSGGYGGGGRGRSRSRSRSRGRGGGGGGRRDSRDRRR